MPTYQYACKDCDHRFEAVQSFSDTAFTECPVCMGRLRKVFSAVGVVFKGSGFYRTDSRAAPKDSTGKDAAAKGSSPNGEAVKTAAPEGSGGGASGSTRDPSGPSGSTSASKASAKASSTASSAA